MIPLTRGTESSPIHRERKYKEKGRMGTEFQFYKIKRVMEVDVSNGCECT